MAVGVRPKPYAVDPPADASPALRQVLTNIDEMLQTLFEDLYLVDQAALTLASIPTPAPAAAGSPWTLLFTSTPTAVNSVDFTGLSGYTDIRVIVRAITFGAVDRPTLRVSTDNGATFLAAAGDYISISAQGVPTNQTFLDFMEGDNTTSRNGEIYLEGINLTTTPKVSRSNFFNSPDAFLRIMPTTSAVNAVRVLSRLGNNYTGGTIYVLGRV